MTESEAAGRIDEIIEGYVGRQVRDDISAALSSTDIPVDSVAGVVLVIALIIFAIGSLFKSLGLFVQKSTPIAQPFADVLVEGIREKRSGKHLPQGSDDVYLKINELSLRVEALEAEKCP